MAVPAMESSENGGGGRPKLNKYAFACAAVASTISIIFGYDTGVMSGAMIFIKEEFSIKDGNVEVLAGILNLCALLGSLCAGRTSDYLGRRYTIVLAAAIFMVGSVLMGYGPNYGVLLAGRCVAGVGVGFALMIAPVYATEISPADSRGFLSSLPEVGISVGILLGYISNNVFSNFSLKIGWRLMLGIAAVPSLILAVGILKMPESPRWLATKGKFGEAREVLYKVCDEKEEAEQRLKDIVKSLGIDGHSTAGVRTERGSDGGASGVWKELLFWPTPTIRRMLIAGLGIHFFEHATGVEAVILYGPRIFRAAGLHTKQKLLLATVGVGLTKLTFITISTFIIDKVGRRKLLLLSIAGMIVSLTGLASCLTVIEHTGDGQLLWALVLSLISVYCFQIFFNIGLCPVCWVYSSEIFPQRLRAAGASLSVAVNRLMNATVSMSFLSLSAAITIGGAFYLFAGMAVLAWIFVFFCLPETKGQSLEEMEEIFDKAQFSNVHKKQMELVNLLK